jgi:hypothetical protein
MLAFILAAGLGLAALSRPSALSASAMFSLLLLSLAVAFIGILYRRGQQRAFWTGFLICGSLYAVLSLAPWFDYNVGPCLVTTAILDSVYPNIPLLENTSKLPYDPWKSWTGSPPDYPYLHLRRGFTTSTVPRSMRELVVFNVATTDEFLSIGHSLFGMLLAVAGGCLAKHFYETRIP